MLESEAIVVKIEAGTTFVTAQIPSNCGSQGCDTQGCSSAVLTRLFSQQPKALRVSNTIGAHVGERVLVGLEEGAFLKSALLAYGLPLLALIVGAVGGMQLASTESSRDLYAGIGGLLGLGVSALVLKFLLRGFLRGGTQAVILRRI